MFRLQFTIPALFLALASGAIAQNTGTSFCNVTNNSTGMPTTLTGTSGSGVGSDLHLEVTQGVPGELAYFLAGNEATSGMVISNGLNCLVGTGTAQMFRYNVAGGSWNSVGRFDTAGVFQNLVGTSAVGSGFDVPDSIPGLVPIMIMSGDTWHFQVWHRDRAVFTSESNFSNGLSVTFPVAPVLIAGMVPIPAGSFEMGSNASNVSPYFNGASQQPVHSVTISEAFWMGEHEVTQAQYQALMGVNPSGFSGATLPVERVSWNHARAYCTALTAQEMAAGHLPAGYEYRLPTEAEWEYACRAGTTTEFNVGADLFCADAQFAHSYHSNSSCGTSSTIAVGSHPANAFGLYDMHGNVWEWCLDSIASYSAGSATDPLVTGGSDRVVRGGGWDDNSAVCRSAQRGGITPGFSASFLGFRVVLGLVLDPEARPVPVPGMVQIPAGSFDMGSDALDAAPYFNNASQQPVHNVTISEAFWMGEYEVTQGEYQALIGVNPSHFPGATSPVEFVSWDDARAYCAALTAQEMAAGNLPVGYEYRLPTEAEWEYACRAGTTTEFNVGTDLFCADARFGYSHHSSSSCGILSTTAVGSYPANTFGLYDMHGNVGEWCLDAFAGYSAGAVTDPFVTVGLDRVYRGGTWNFNSANCRSAIRSSANPGGSSNFVGFRVALGLVLVP